jgi:hypothetical protein
MEKKSLSAQGRSIKHRPDLSFFTPLSLHFHADASQIPSPNLF